MKPETIMKIETAPSTAALPILAKTLALAGGRKGEALRLADAIGVPSRVKAAIGAHTTGDEDLAGLVDSRVIATQFIPILRNSSMFYRLLDGSMLNRIPLRTRVSYTTASASAFIVGEGAAVPLSQMALEGVILDVVKVCGLVVFSDELLRSGGSASDALLTRELRRAISAAVDSAFLGIVIDGSTPTQASSAATPAGALADVNALVDDVAPTAESRLIFALAPDVARAAATLHWSTGAKVFPDLGLMGGSILDVPAMVVDALPAGVMLLIDGTGVAGDSDAIRVEASDEATIEMDTEPTQDATTGTGSNSVSMFQTNSVAIMAKAFFGAERIRDNAVAQVTGIAWASA